MATVLKKVTSLLKEMFPPPDQVNIKDDNGIIARVISSSFSGLDSLDRIKTIWDVLDKKLTPEERAKIVIILAVTPSEHQFHTAGRRRNRAQNRIPLSRPRRPKRRHGPAAL